MNESVSFRDHSRRYSVIVAPLFTPSSQLINALFAVRHSTVRFRGASGTPGPERTSRYSDHEPAYNRIN
jgi:hypothetical protein